MREILVSSGYGGNTHMPFVQIESDDIDRPIQISPEEARDLALNLLQAAEGAQTDAFLFEFAAKQLHASLEESASLLSHFRAFRDEMRPESTIRSQPPTNRYSEIIVNGRTVLTPANKLNYDELVELAFQKYDPKVIYTVVFEGADIKDDGTLQPGETLFIKTGTVINVANTSSA
jgi:hypothetical protein